MRKFLFVAKSLALLLLLVATENRAEKTLTSESLDSLYELRFYEQIFNLDNKQFTHIQPLAFWGMDDLRILNLSHNAFGRFARYTFHGMPNLEILDLSFNSIDRLDNETFSKLISLETLNLRGNRLKYKEPGVPWFTNPNLVELTSLDLSRNQLYFIDERTFSNLHKLEVLNLEYNRIYNIPNGTFDDLANIEEINLKNNNLKVISPPAVNSICILRLKLEGNPLFKYLRLDTISRQTAGIQAPSKYSHDLCATIAFNELYQAAVGTDELSLGLDDYDAFVDNAAVSFFFTWMAALPVVCVLFYL